MIVPAIILVLAAAPAVDPERLPPEPRQAPSIQDLRQPPPTAIFTYRVDPQCRVTDVRKLQGAEDVSWEDAQGFHEVFREATVWRFVEGLRRQLHERRVKLMGEMIREGELVCRVLPSGEVLEAWIEREDTGAARRRTPVREPVPTRGGAIGDLGTFSLDLDLDLEMTKSAS